MFLITAKKSSVLSLVTAGTVCIKMDHLIKRWHVTDSVLDIHLSHPKTEKIPLTFALNQNK